MKRHHRSGRLLGSLALLLAAGVAQAEPGWVRARRADFRRDLTEVGEIQAVESSTIKAPLEWRSALQIVRIVPEGSYVQPGDTLVQFDAAFLETEINKTRTQLERDRVDLDRILAEQSSRRTGLQNALLSAGFSQEQAELQLEKLEYESETRQLSARLTLQKAEVALREAGAKLRAQATLDSLEVAKAQLKIDGGEGRLNNDLDQAEGMTLVAPGPGLVVYGTRGRDDPRKIRLGDEINPGSPVIEIPNLETVDVVFDVHEVDREKLAVDMPLTLTLEAFPDQIHRARVASLALLAQPLEQDSQVRRFRVVARIEAAHDTLKPGMTARVRIELEVRPDAVVVPLQALFEQGAQPVVFERGRWPDPTSLTLLATDDLVAAVAGVAPDAELATEAPDGSGVHPLGYARFIDEVGRWGRTEGDDR